MTKNYTLVYEFLENSKRPMSVEEIKYELRATKIGIATIYRIVNKGVKSGQLKEIEFPSGGKRYEIEGLSHQHHFICDKAFDITGCVKGIKNLIPNEFKLTSHEIYFYGQCSDCALS